jgi:hypothetical protein
MALLELGRTVATPAALRVCEAQGVAPLALLRRHAGGDWGDLCAADVQANVEAIQHGLRVLSSYALGQDKIWVITEADRSSTCLLLPEEY